MTGVSRAALWVIRLALLQPCLCACSSSGEVTRLVRGQPVPGRYISVAAYASYARGAYLESHGDLRGAGVAYEQAARFDDESAEIWTRIADLRCRSADPRARAAYTTARRLDPEYEPIWRSLAQCELRGGSPRTALRYALHALKLDPNQEETSLILVRIYERLGLVRDAERYLDAWVARSPRSVLALQTLLQFGKEHADGARAERAQAALRLLRSQRKDVLDLTRGDRFHDIDRALQRGDLKRARELAVLGSVSSNLLAVRAAALGASALALEQAELVLAADPSDADARIASLVAADLSGDAPRFERSLARTAFETPVPSALAARLLADLLARRIGPDAARTWLEAYGGLPAPRDALERALDARLLHASD